MARAMCLRDDFEGRKEPQAGGCGISSKHGLGRAGRSFPNTRTPMPPLNPDVADLAPSDPALTAYDEEHAVTYLRMLDADAEGVD